MTPHARIKLLAMVVVAALATAPGAAQEPDTNVGGDDLRGVVRSPGGPEAGVWVIAETDDLDTLFRKNGPEATGRHCPEGWTGTPRPGRR